ncbi:hypothetical protein [Dactylosporangium sp. NPDC051541]|uniref:hypothetical protein n=1 Tax=Dactylosporangium sp. NPDC051541 TaxID=3363977 RepID=UPI0037A37C51
MRGDDQGQDDRGVPAEARGRVRGAELGAEEPADVTAAALLDDPGAHRGEQRGQRGRGDGPDQGVGAAEAQLQAQHRADAEPGRPGLAAGEQPGPVLPPRRQPHGERGDRRRGREVHAEDPPAVGRERADRGPQAERGQPVQRGHVADVGDRAQAERGADGGEPEAAGGGRGGGELGQDGGEDADQ